MQAKKRHSEGKKSQTYILRSENKIYFNSTLYTNEAIICKCKTEILGLAHKINKIGS